jgi:cytochrome P450
MDLSEPRIQQDPWPTYAALRKASAVAPIKSEFRKKPALVVTRYDDVVLVYKDSRFSNDMAKHMPLLLRWLMKLPGSFDMMLLKDDPEHKRLRGLVDKAFTPQMVAAMQPRIQRITEDLLDNMAGKERVDLVADFALPLPLTVISEMLGVPKEESFAFHQLMSASFRATSITGLRRLMVIPNMIRMKRLFRRLIKRRRDEPDDRLITALINIYDQGDHLSDREILGMIFLLLFAGHETSVNLIGSGMLALLERPDQLAKLRDKPDLIDPAVEELLRFSSPVVYGASRFPTEDVRIGDTLVPKGTEVIGILSSANRDDSVFENPEKLDITRNPNKHIAFGVGIHFCLGVWLAREEGKIAINALVKRFPDIQLAAPPELLRWRMGRTSALRGLESLPLKLTK